MTKTTYSPITFINVYTIYLRVVLNLKTMAPMWMGIYIYIYIYIYTHIQLLDCTSPPTDIIWFCETTLETTPHEFDNCDKLEFSFLTHHFLLKWTSYFHIVIHIWYVAFTIIIFNSFDWRFFNIILEDCKPQKWIYKMRLHKLSRDVLHAK